MKLLDRIWHECRDDGTITHALLTPGGAPFPLIAPLSTDDRSVLYRFNRGGASFYIQLLDKLVFRGGRVLAVTEVKGDLFTEIAPIDLGIGFGGADAAYSKLCRKVGKPFHTYSEVDGRCLYWNDSTKSVICGAPSTTNLHVCLPPGASLALAEGQDIGAVEFYSVKLNATNYKHDTLSPARAVGTNDCLTVWPVSMPLVEHADELIALDPAEAEATVRAVDPRLHDMQQALTRMRRAEREVEQRLRLGRQMRMQPGRLAAPSAPILTQLPG